MKNVFFIMTHLGSGWEKLSTCLKECPFINVYQTGNSYNHPDDILLLRNNFHSNKNIKSIWVDTILYNKDFTMKSLCNYYYFIFWTKPLKESLDEIIEKYNYKEKQAIDYYNYRLIGINQYYKRCKNNSINNPKLNIKGILDSIF